MQRDKAPRVVAWMRGRAVRLCPAGQGVQGLFTHEPQMATGQQGLRVLFCRDLLCSSGWAVLSGLVCVYHLAEQ